MYPLFFAPSVFRVLAVALSLLAAVSPPPAAGHREIRAKTARTPPQRATAGTPSPFDRPSFVNDIVPVLTKAGCNAGACHGSQYGKGGFKLSLRGYDPELDHRSILKEAGGRRVSAVEPERSLLLRKPAGEVPHAGGVRLPRGSAGYALCLHWLTSGAPGPLAKERRLTALEVSPAETTLPVGSRRSMVATARFDDGSTRDVTLWTRFFSNQENVATVDDSGQATVLGTGEAIIRAHYGTEVAIARLLVPREENSPPASLEAQRSHVGITPPPAPSPKRRGGRTLVGRESPPWSVAFQTPSPLRGGGRGRGNANADRPGSEGPQAPGLAFPRNPLDTAMEAKLARLGIVPSERCSDAEFLRRVTLDVAGVLPTVMEARRFMESRDPNKRQKWIDALLSRPEYVDTWTYRLSDLLRNSRRSLGVKGMEAFHRYLRDAVARNRPWDAIVRELVTARGSLWDAGPANYYGVGSTPEEWAENTSQVFMGVRIQCARCHNHPFDRWTQADYYSFAAFFGRLQTKSGGERGDKVVFVADEGEVKHPKTSAVMPPRALGAAKPVSILDDADRREALARWLTAPENRWFARAIVNRVWRHLLGRGLVEPVDDVRATNPSANEAALRALADDFVANDYDLKHVIRVIANSTTYQRSATPNGTNRFDETHFSRHVVRRLGAEQILDAVACVTGVPEKFPGVPLGARAAQLPDTAVPSYFLDLFGRPARASVCECEREMAPNLAQRLQVMNGDSVNAGIRSPEGRLAKLLASEKTDEAVLEELFLAALTRRPNARERTRALDTIRAAPSRQEGFADLLWALLNSREFLFTH